jgi:hypothetical protein
MPKKPAGQHCPQPGAAYVPAAQTRQAEGETEPAAAVKRPAGQGVHAASPVPSE